MRDIIISQVNNTYHSVSKRDSTFIIPALLYESVWWVDGPHHKIKKVANTPLIVRKKNEVHFLSGNLARVERHLDSKGIPYIVEEEESSLYEEGINLASIQLRGDQRRLLDIGISKKKGLVISPTGSGKTVIILGIISTFKNYNILILAHTVEIVNQTARKIKEQIPELKDRIQVLGGGNSTFDPSVSVTVSTIQTFVKQDLEGLKDHFPIVMVDESHHVAEVGKRGKEGFKFTTYGKVLTILDSLITLGFSATKQTAGKKGLSCEGLLGPVLGELTNEDAINLGIIARPIIKLHQVPYSHKISAMRGKYPEIYNAGIVLNDVRNELIKSITLQYMAQKFSVLILVSRIEHGEILSDMIGVDFLQGSTQTETRDAVRKAFIQKEVLCVIATAIWKEGVDIPSVDVVLNAAGGKSEIQTIQSIGRGFRKTADKDSFIVEDFFDNTHRFFVEHFGERLCLYFSLGWL